MLENEVACAPQQLLDDALHRVLQSNWESAFTKVSATTIDKHENVITSHIL